MNNHNAIWKKLSALAVLMTLIVSVTAQNSRMKTNQTLPPGYWPLEKSQSIIDKTQTIKLA
ncbi:MAG: hypothetical protein QOI77_3923, partial [Blastocatellia bacterium]|nr:hypothetical protein [Blastocatellia bacterium]